MGELVRSERRGPAAWLTLAAPENRNALTGPMLGALAAAVHAALDDRTVRAIVLTGTGPAFCAGADLKAGGGVAAAGNGNPFVALLRTLWEGPKPVVAAVNGAAYGGGLGLVAAADIVVAVESAAFAFSEVRLGVIPAMISVVVLPRIGPHHAMRLFLTGARFDAGEAARIGLVHRVVPAAELEVAAQAEVAEIARGGPIAVAEAKRLVRTVPRLGVDEAFSWAEAKIAELFASEEAAEGMAAFAAKRRPRWAEE